MFENKVMQVPSQQYGAQSPLMVKVAVPKDQLRTTHTSSKNTCITDVFNEYPMTLRAVQLKVLAKSRVLFCERALHTVTFSILPLRIKSSESKKKRLKTSMFLFSFV